MTSAPPRRPRPAGASRNRDLLGYVSTALGVLALVASGAAFSAPDQASSGGRTTAGAISLVGSGALITVGFRSLRSRTE